MFLKKKKADKAQDSKIILGMVMLLNEQSFDKVTFTADYNSHYVGKIEKTKGDNASIAITVDGESVVIAHMPVPIPSSDLEVTAQYAYNWLSALEDTKEHKSHLIVSLIQGGQDYLKRFKIFTQVLCSLLRTTNSLGVYKGNQSLLIPTGDYLSDAKFMSDDYLPLNLWIYFGLRVSEGGNSGYTYGLKEFGKIEMEVINSSRSIEDVRGFLFDIAHYVLEYDVAFQDGQTVGNSEEERHAIAFSRGQFVEGDTFKFSY